MGSASSRVPIRDEKEYTTVFCHCGRKATYRCEWQPDDVVFAIRPAPVDHPALESYWSASTMFTHQYVACDKCITDEIRGLMIHHPNGWKEHAKEHIHYEKIKLGRGCL